MARRYRNAALSDLDIQIQVELRTAERALQKALGMCQRARRDPDVDQVRLRGVVRDLSRAASVVGVIRPTVNPYPTMEEEEVLPPPPIPEPPVPVHVPVEAGE